MAHNSSLSPVWTPFSQTCPNEFTRTNHLPQGARIPYTIGDPSLGMNPLCAQQKRGEVGLVWVPIPQGHYGQGGDHAHHRAAETDEDTLYYPDTERTKEGYIRFKNNHA